MSKVTFVIRRANDFAEWFAGWNAFGPIWTSDPGAAAKVRHDLLVVTMLELEGHKPSASIAGPKDTKP